jgi:DHA2 family multidrug resistance protein
LTGNQATPQWQPTHNPWVIAMVVAAAAFMEVLDTSIANVALPHISGDLGASQDESTWVLTTYLVANAVVLPITGWLSSVVGRKRFFMICIALFTLASLFCGAAPTLRAAAACSPWRSPSWPTASRPNCAEPPLRCSA